ncbi:MAG: arginine deiminase family protein [Deltaproteobacteria bacterium]|nr:arginine deiminase family protein [Deltaproteobacteria bacterium]
MGLLYGVDSEYKGLRAIILHRPGPEIGEIRDPVEVLHVRGIDPVALDREYDGIINLYERLGVKVFLMDADVPESERRSLYNLMYVRDLLFMTPEGAVISRMGHPVRQGEVACMEKTAGAIGLPVIKKIEGEATFEGADALWLDPRHVMVGIGKRTNHDGFRELDEALSRQGVNCIPVPAPSLSLHLMGSVQIVDSGLALVRAESVDREIMAVMRKIGIKTVAIAENEEIEERHAMNIVTIGPGRVIMPSGCPMTRKVYERHGIEVVAEVETRELANGGGGLACATGILLREAAL